MGETHTVWTNGVINDMIIFNKFGEIYIKIGSSDSDFMDRTRLETYLFQIYVFNVDEFTL